MRLGIQVVTILAAAGFEDANKACKDFDDYCDGLNFSWFDVYTYRRNLKKARNSFESKNGVISFVMPSAF